METIILVIWFDINPARFTDFMLHMQHEIGGLAYGFLRRILLLLRNEDGIGAFVETCVSLKTGEQPRPSSGGFLTAEGA
jgi:hypothetical protein